VGGSEFKLALMKERAEISTGISPGREASQGNHNRLREGKSRQGRKKKKKVVKRTGKKFSIMTRRTGEN